MGTAMILSGLSRSRTKKGKEERQLLDGKFELCDEKNGVIENEVEDTGVKVDLTMPSSVQESLASKDEDIEISRREVQVTLKVGLTLPPPIQDCLENGIDAATSPTGVSKLRRKQREKKCKRLREKLELCDNTIETEVSKSVVEGIDLKFDSNMPVSIRERPADKDTPGACFTVPSPIQEHPSSTEACPASTFAGLSDSQKKHWILQLNKKENLIVRLLELCEKIWKNDVAEMRRSQKKHGRSELNKREKMIAINLELCAKKREEDIAVMSISQLNDWWKYLKELERDLELCHKGEETDIAKSEKPNTGKKIKISNVDYKDIQRSTDQITVMSALSLSDNCQGAVFSYELNKVQSTNQVFGFSPQGCKSNKCCETDIMRIIRSIEVNEHSQHADSMPSINVAEDKLDPGINESSVHVENASDKNQNERNAIKHYPIPDDKRVDNILKVSHFSPERTLHSRLRKKLLVLDVNGLLADVVMPPPKELKSDINIYGRAIFKRPFLDDFLRFIFKRFDVAIWSSRSRKVLLRLVNYLLGDLSSKLILFWDMTNCTTTKFNSPENKYKPIVLKELRKIWEEGYHYESNTLLVDDSPYKGLLNPDHTSIFPVSYSYTNKNDNSLGPGGDLRVYLENLASAESVKIYIEKHPFGQPRIDQTSPDWKFYSQVVSSVSRSHQQIAT